jgi:AraC-like DNA-binding protein
MATSSPSVKVYPVVKISMIVRCLGEEGIAADRALAGTGVSEAALSSPQTRVSITQVIECYRNAMQLSQDPWFAYHTGLRFHLSTYGLYGFAMLSSPCFRETVGFLVRYHALATPLADIAFSEHDGRALWTIDPRAHPLVDLDLYRFLVELHWGVMISLHRDFMGGAFAAREATVAYAAPVDAADYPKVFGFPVRPGEAANTLAFDSSWLDRPAELGNPLVYPTIVALCDALLEELERREGLAGQVRRALLARGSRPASADEIAAELKLSPRTLRRRLQEEETSFREVLDELRAEMAIKYIRETDFSVDEIAAVLGFSEPAAFRHAFRRWTHAAPSRFRDLQRPHADLPSISHQP